MDDLRAARDRIEDLGGDLDRIEGDRPDCSLVLLGQTAQLTTYPTAAGSTYYCHVLSISFAESEGAAITTTDTGAAVFASNLGTAAPPQGTKVLLFQVGDRWAFSFNG